MQMRALQAAEIRNMFVRRVIILTGAALIWKEAADSLPFPAFIHTDKLGGNPTIVASKGQRIHVVKRSMYTDVPKPTEATFSRRHLHQQLRLECMLQVSINALVNSQLPLYQWKNDSDSPAAPRRRLLYILRQWRLNKTTNKRAHQSYDTVHIFSAVYSYIHESNNSTDIADAQFVLIIFYYLMTDASTNAVSDIQGDWLLLYATWLQRPALVINNRTPHPKPRQYREHQLTVFSFSNVVTVIFTLVVVSLLRDKRIIQDDNRTNSRAVGKGEEDAVSAFDWGTGLHDQSAELVNSKYNSQSQYSTWSTSKLLIAKADYDAVRVIQYVPQTQPDSQLVDCTVVWPFSSLKVR